MPEETILNKAIVDELRDILGDGFRNIFQQQIDQGNAYIEEIRHLIAKGEMGQVARRAHSLKSSAGQVGLIGVQGLAKELEDAASASAVGGGISPRAMEAFARLVRAQEVAVKSLHEYVA